MIIPPSDWDPWLKGENVGDLLKPFPEDSLKSYPVSRAVNSPQNEDPSLIEPAGNAVRN